MIELTLGGIVGWICTGVDGLAVARPIFARLADEWHDRPPPNHHLAKGMWTAAVRGFHSCMQELYDKSNQGQNSTAFWRFKEEERKLRRKDLCLFEEPIITDEMGFELERDLPTALLNLCAQRDDYAVTITAVREQASARMWNVFCGRFQATMKHPAGWTPPLEVSRAFYGNYPAVRSWFDHYCLRVGAELKKNPEFRHIFEGMQLAQLNERVRAAIAIWEDSHRSLLERFDRSQLELEAIARSQHAMERKQDWILRAVSVDVQRQSVRFQGLSGVTRFKELEFFDKTERALFHGRARWCKAALDRFGASWSKPALPFFGITGESGTGKSSLLRAGLAGALEEDLVYGRAYRVVVITAHELASSGKAFRDSPLGCLVKQAVDELGRAAKVHKLLADIESSYDKPKSAVSALVRLLDENATGGGEIRLVLGLDQFEELLDRRVSADETAGLSQLFKFLCLACESGRIGVLLTCQKNRQKLLEDDKILGPLLKKGGLLEVTFPEEPEIKEIVQETFRSVGVELSSSIVGELYRRIDELGASSRVSLLPLLSLTLRNLYKHCAAIGNELQSASRSQIRSESPRRFSRPLDGEADRGLGFQFQSKIRMDGVLVVEANEVPPPLLDIAKAISDQADVALGELQGSPNWDDEVLATQLRRLVRIHSIDEGRFDLSPVSIPARGAGRLLIERFRHYRLLVEATSDRVQLVHEAVIRHWPRAQQWLFHEASLLGEIQILSRDADQWDAQGRPVPLTAIDETKIELYGRLLRSLWNVFHPRDGSAASDKDKLRCDFLFAVLETAMTPSAEALDSKGRASHFLTAVSYGRLELVRKYLQIEPDAARDHRSGNGGNAAYFAVFSGSVEMLELVIDHGADPELANLNGHRAVNVAANFDNIDILDRLIDKGASLASAVKGVWPPLHTAVARDDSDMVSRMLSAYGADPNATDDDEQTPLHVACQYASADLVSLLLSQDLIDASAKSNRGQFALLIACSRGDARMVNLLLQHRTTDPSATTSDGRTALHLAITSRSHEAVCELLRNSVIDRKSPTPDKNRKSVVELAIDTGKLDVLSALLDDPHGLVDPDSVGSSRETPLFSAVKAGKVEVVDALISAGARVDPEDPLRESALMLAARNGDVAVAELLLPHADVLACDRDGRSVLHLAAQLGHYGIVELLLERLTAQAAPDDNGRESTAAALSRLRDLRAFAPVHLAAENGHARTVKTLLDWDRGLREYEDGIGRRVLHIAASRGHVDLLTELIEEDGADVRDVEYMTPLHHAALAGHAEVVQALVGELGADPNVSDQFGWRPVHLAAQGGHRDAVDKLLHRADSALDVDMLLLAAASAGQSEILDLISSRLSAKLGQIGPWVEALCAALENAQHGTALRLLQKQPSDLVIPDDCKPRVAEAFARSMRENANSKEMRQLRFLLVDAGYPIQAEQEPAPAVPGAVAPGPSSETMPKALQLHDYSWSAAPAELCSDLISRLTPVDGKHLLSADTTRMDLADLDWYDDVRLVRLFDPTWVNRDLNLYYLVTPQRDLFRLNGTSPPIHEVNARAPIRLTRENVMSYLIFFTFFVRGEEGPFYCPQSEDDPFLGRIKARAQDDDQIAAALVALEGTLREASFEGMDEQGNFLIDAVVFYSNAIFMANFLVQPGGMVEMPAEEPIAADLPFRINGPIA